MVQDDLLGKTCCLISMVSYLLNSAKLIASIKWQKINLDLHFTFLLLTE